MSDFDEKLDSLESELADNQPPPGQPMSFEQFLASSNAAPAGIDSPNDDTPSPMVTGANIGEQVGSDLSGPSSPSPAQASAIQPPAVGGGGSPQPSVSDYINQRLAEQQGGLQDAQDAAATNTLYANIAEGLGQATAGAARSNTFNPESYKYLQQNAQAPVQNFEAAQKNRIQGLQAMEAENAARRQTELQNPNSMQSQIARNLAAKSLQHYGEDPKLVNGMSAADLQFLEKPLDQMEARESREAVQKLKQRENDLKQQELNQTKNEKNDTEFTKWINTQDSYKKPKEMAAHADTISDLAQEATTNGTSAANLPVEIGSFAQQGGRLHNLSVEANKQIGSLLTRAQNEISKSATGTISQPLADDIKTFVSSQKQSATNQMNNQLRIESEVYKKIHKQYPSMYDPSQYSSPAATQSSANNRVRVISPDGKTGSIPTSQLQDAFSQGYKQAQ